MASRNFELERFEQCSSWQRLKKAVALCLLLKKWLKSKVSKQPFSGSRIVTRQKKQSLYDSVLSTDMQEAELEILKQVQSNVFHVNSAVYVRLLSYVLVHCSSLIALSMVMA